jgi:hypothetical protein
MHDAPGLATHPLGSGSRCPSLTHSCTLGQLLLRSLLRNTGTTVLNNPTVLGIRPAEGERALLQHVGTAWLDLLLADTGPEGAFGLSEALRRTASTEGLDKLILAAIKTASEYPEVFRLENTAFETWLKHVLTDLYTGHADGEPFFDTDLFPEVAFLVVENGLRNLPMLLMDGMEQEQRLLLTQVARQLFEALAERQPNGRMAWRFALARARCSPCFNLCSARWPCTLRLLGKLTASARSSYPWYNSLLKYCHSWKPCHSRSCSRVAC